MKDWHWLLLVFPATNFASAVSFMLLCSLSYVKTQHQSSLLRHLMLLVTIISVNLQDKSQNSSNLKIPALTFLRTALESTDPSIWQKHLPVLSPAVFATVGERYYKVTAPGLHLCHQAINAVTDTWRLICKSPLMATCILSFGGFTPHFVSFTCEGLLLWIQCTRVCYS